MYYQNDWILREIEIMTRFIVIAVFGKDIPLYDMMDEDLSQGTDLLRREILHHLKKGDICKAEDMLFGYLDKEKRNMKDIVKIALDFYSTINAWTDQELADANFPRDEVLQGLQDFSNHLGLPEILKLT